MRSICPSVCLSHARGRSLLSTICLRTAAGHPSCDPPGCPSARPSVCRMLGVEVFYLRLLCAVPLGIPHATQQDVQLCVCLSVRLSVPCSRSKSAIYGIPHSCICPSVRLSVCPSVRPSVCLSMRPDATITVAACRRVPSAAGDPSRDPAGRPTSGGNYNFWARRQTFSTQSNNSLDT